MEFLKFLLLNATNGFFTRYSNIFQLKPQTIYAVTDMTCNPPHNFKVTLIHEDLLTVTFHCLTKRLSVFCTTLIQSPSLEFVWLSTSYSSAFAGYTIL